jgi:hypothetical protein
LAPPAAERNALPCRRFDFQVNGFAGVDFQRGDLAGTQVRRAVSCLGLPLAESLRLWPDAAAGAFGVTLPAAA